MPLPPLEWLVVLYGLAMAVLGALLVRNLLPSLATVRSYFALRQRAYDVASRSALRWRFREHIAASMASAAAARFAARSREVGLEAAWRELEEWERSCEATNNLLELPQAEALDKIQDVLETRLGGRVINWKPRRKA